MESQVDGKYTEIWDRWNQSSSAPRMQISNGASVNLPETGVKSGGWLD